MGAASQRQSAETDPSARSETSPGTLFHVLRNQRRRFAIHYLERADEPVDVGELARQIAAWENDVPVSDVTSEQRRRVYNALQQTHIAELDDAGLVTVERRDVELTERADELDVYLDIVHGKDVPWSEYYLGLGATGTVAAVATWLHVGPFAPVPAGAVAVCLGATLLVSAAVNYYDQHRNRLGDHEKPPELRDGS